MLTRKCILTKTLKKNKKYNQRLYSDKIGLL
jgi:hypothetical protein